MQKVTVCVAQEAAIERGSAKWGDLSISLEAVLDELTIEERRRIDVDKEGRLRVEHPGVGIVGMRCMRCLNADSAATDDVVVAVRRTLAETDKRVAEDLAVARKRALSYLEGAKSGLWSVDTPLLRDAGETDLLERCIAEDARREAERKAERDAIRRKWAEQVIAALDADKPIPSYPFGFSTRKDLPGHAPEDLRDALKEALERADKRAADSQATAEAALLAWGQSYGSEDVQRAIAEGYPLGDRLTVEARAWVLGMCVLPGAEVVPDADVGGERPVPSADAYDFRDSLAEYVSSLQLPNPCEAMVGRLVRLTDERWVSHDCGDPEYCDVCDDDGEVKERRKLTGVVVTVRTPWQTYKIPVALVEHE